MENDAVSAVAGDDTFGFLRQSNGQLAYRSIAGNAPGVFFLSGFMSDMSGTKVRALAAHCRQVGRAFVSFDYRGHGQSSGSLANSGVGEWLDDAIAVFDAFAQPGAATILVGSSMGGWIATLLLQRRRERIAGFLGIAAAPDYDDALRASLTPVKLKAIERQGCCEIPTPYGPDPYVISRRLLETASMHHVLGSRIDFTGPVRLHHGLADAEIPWERSVSLAKSFGAADVEVRLIGGGDHRLCSTADLSRLCAAVDDLARNGNPR